MTKKSNNLYLKFKYHYRNLCWDSVYQELDREEKIMINENTDFKLSVAKQNFQIVDVNEEDITIQMGRKKIKVKAEDTNFYYEEYYEFFDDVRYNEFLGSIKLIKEK